MTAAQNELDVSVGDARLISLEEACQRAARHVTPIHRSETVSIVDALDRVLAEKVCARIALPPFDQSAMDGYALAACSIDRIETELPIASRITAGASSPSLPAGAAARIFTGAPIPRGADTVVMQEHVRRDGLCVWVDGPVRQGSNIRRRGEDIAKGEALLQVGQRLDARHLALLAAQGFASIQVFHQPRIAVASTGDELRQPAETLGEAAVFELESADAAGSRASSGSRRDRRRVYPRRRQGNGPPSLRPRRNLRHGRHNRRRFCRRGGPFGGSARSERSLLRSSQNCTEARKASSGRALPARRLFGASRKSRLGFGCLVYRR